MRKIRKLFIIVLLLVIPGLQQLSHTIAFADETTKSVTILFTHDLHDNFYPAKTKVDGVVKSLGGYARLQSAINQEKEQDPNAILVDAGDFSMGTPFQTIYQSDAPELRIMGQMGYDATTLGNHEFDYRADGLAGSLESATRSGERLPQIVQANVTFPTDGDGTLTESLQTLKEAMNDYGVKEYITIERNDIKVGIFGVMGEESASMAPMSEVVFDHVVKHAKRIVKILKDQEKVDLILCLSHSGTSTDSSESEDEILAKEVPDIDVIISGHTHTKLSKPIVIGSTVIGSAEDYGKNLGVIKLKQQEDDWQLVDYRLVPIDENIPEDNTIVEAASRYKDIVQEKYFSKFNLQYDEVIAYAPFDFQTVDEVSDHHGESTLGNLISDAYLYAVKKAEGDQYKDDPVTAAIVPSGTIRGTMFQGAITVSDAFSISSLGIGADKMPGYPLISVYLTGKELIATVEVDASITPIMEEAQLFLSGVEHSFNPNRLFFNKVVDVSLVNSKGEQNEIDEDQLYRVVCGLYSAQMLSAVEEKSFGLMSIVPKKKDGTPITDYEEHIIYDTSGETKSELKEWYAIVQYLKSFEEVNGIPLIPDYYSEVHGRKNVVDEKSITALFRNPNHIALTVYIVVPIVLGLIILIIIFVVRLIKHHMRKLDI